MAFFFLVQNFPASELINIARVPAVTYAQMDRVILIASLLGCNQVRENVTATADNQNIVKPVLSGTWA